MVSPDRLINSFHSFAENWAHRNFPTFLTSSNIPIPKYRNMLFSRKRNTPLPKPWPPKTTKKKWKTTLTWCSSARWNSVTSPSRSPRSHKHHPANSRHAWNLNSASQTQPLIRRSKSYILLFPASKTCLPRPSMTHLTGLAPSQTNQRCPESRWNTKRHELTTWNPHL